MKTEQKGFSCWAESEERAKLYVEIKKQEEGRKGWEKEEQEGNKSDSEHRGKKWEESQKI